MDFKTFFIKKLMMSFFVSTACIGVAMGVLGLLFEPGTQFGYEALFMPHIYGAVAVLPQLATYSSKELSVKQTLLRQVIHLLLLEGAILFIIFWGRAVSASTVAAVALSILIIYLTVHLVLWINDRRTMKEFNLMLKAMQQNEGNVT